MKSGTFELCVFLESISSFSLEKTTFYTVILRAGPKEIQLPQKKCLTQSHLLSLLQKMTIKLDENELENSRNLAKIQVYSVQKYGKKKLQGYCQFLFEPSNLREMKVPFTLNQDQKAQIKFSYGFFKMQSTLLSQKSFCSSSSRKSYSQDKNTAAPTFLLAELEEKPLREQERRRKKFVIQNMLNPSLFHDQTTFEAYRVSANVQNFMPEKRRSTEGNLENSQDSNKKTSQNFARLSSLNTTNHQLSQLSRFDLQLESRVIQYTAISQQKNQSSNKKPKENRLGTPRALSISDFGQHLLSVDQSCVKGSRATKRQDKLRIIRPNNKLESFQQWANDDNLVNVLHQMLNQVKGNVGFIKLSKLTQLTKIITQAKNTNRRLSVANNMLLQNQNWLQKKISELEQNIKDSEERYPAQIASMRNQIKETEKKLVDKYSEELFREKKLKQAQAKIQAYEKQIKDLQSQLDIKTKQVQHLRGIANSYEEQQNPVIEQKNQQPRQQNKQPKFKRSSSNNIFNLERSDSNKKNRSSSEKDNSQLLTSCPVYRSNQNDTKGINPNFVEFFTSFRGKNANEVKINEYQSMGSIRRKFAVQNNLREQIQSEKEQSIVLMSQTSF